MNPSQKSGNFKSKRRAPRNRKGDYRMKKIARQEAQKVVSKKVESKVHDVNQAVSAVDWSAFTSVFSLTNGLTRGNLATQYVGDSIMPSHLRIRYSLAAADSTNLVRVVVIQNIAGGIPLGNTTFQSTGNNRAPLSAYDLDYSSTYRVLYDEFFALGLGTDSGLLTGDIRIKSNKLRKITYTAGAVVSTGDIYLIAISDSGVSVHPTIQFYSRLYFKDA